MFKYEKKVISDVNDFQSNDEQLELHQTSCILSLPTQHCFLFFSPGTRTEKAEVKEQVQTEARSSEG